MYEDLYVLVMHVIITIQIKIYCQKLKSSDCLIAFKRAAVFFKEGM